MPTISEKKYWEKENDTFEKIDPIKKRKFWLLASFINLLTIIISISYFLYPITPKLQLLLLLVIPWLSFYIVKLNKKYLRIFAFKESKFSGFSITIGFAYWTIIIRTILDYNIIDYSNAWLYSLILAPLLTLLFIKIAEHELELRKENKIAQRVISSAYFIIFYLYSFFVIINLNCTLDYSEQRFVKSKVLDKHTKKSRHSSKNYYIDIVSPKKSREKESIPTSEEEWNNTKIGEHLELGVKDGLLGINWYEVYEVK